MIPEDEFSAFPKTKRGRKDDPGHSAKLHERRTSYPQNSGRVDLGRSLTRIGDWQRLDQERKLYYGKFSWEDAGGWADKGIVTLGMHRHGQERTRMKAVTKGGDFQHFDLDDLGLSVRMERRP